MFYNFLSAGGLIFPAMLLVIPSFRVLREYERGVVFLLGHFWRVKGSGPVLIVPAIQQVVRVGPHTVVVDAPPQGVISHGNVSVKVNTAVYFRVIDPEHVIIQMANCLKAASQLARTTLRAILGKRKLGEMLAEREKFNLDIQRVLDVQTDPWGIKVANVEIRHVDLNESIIRAIARQAEAEHKRRAKVIHAEGELQASKELLEATCILAQQPEAAQLRYLQMLTQIAGDRNSTIVFPLPMEVLGMVKEATGG